MCTSGSFGIEAEFAVRCVRKACSLARLIETEMVSVALEKKDRSPVTVADLLAERDILMFGYRFLENNNLAEALALFKYAVTVYSNSWNAFDGLAEAYIRNGQIDLAIENYKRSLELNPSNDNAKAMLEKLESKCMNEHY